MPSILIVDDMAIFRDPVAAALARHGHTTRTASNGKEALEEVQRSKPDVVLLDITMPVMDGLEALRTLRRQHDPKSLPVIMLTDASEKTRIVEAAKLGISSYVLKSAFSLKEFLERIDEAVAVGKPDTSGAQDAEGTTPPTPGATDADPAGGFVASEGAASLAGVRSIKDLKPIVKRSDVQELIDSCGELKGLSPSVSDIMTMTQRDDCSIEQVVKTIRRDPGISLKLLRVANSCAYDRGEPADTIEKAVMRMGMSGVRQAVLNLSVVEKFAGNEHGDQRLAPEPFWEHSIATGLIAAEITKATAQETGADLEDAVDSAFTMGLLHDAGRMVYAELFGSMYTQVLDASDHLGLPLEQVESRMLLVNHAEAMDRILHAWKFPKHLINPIAFHHLPVAESRKLSRDTAAPAAVLSLSNALAHALLLGHSGNRAIYPIAEAVEALRLEQDVIARIEETIPDQTEDMKYAMLAKSQGDAWPEFADQAKEGLPAAVRPVFVGTTPGLDPVRILLDRLFSPDPQEKPTLAIVHIPQGRDAARVSDQLKKTEADHDCGSLPVVSISPNEKVSLDEAVLAGRTCQQLTIPFTVEGFLDCIRAAGQRPARAA